MTLPATQALDGNGRVLPTLYPVGAVPVTGDSGNVAAGVAAATLAASTTGQTAYLTGFEITSSGSTAAGVVTGTITGVVGGPLHFTYTTVAGATLGNAPLIVAFPSPIPASAPNTAIVVSLPSLGAGNTNTTVTAHGVQV